MFTTPSDLPNDHTKGEANSNRQLEGRNTGAKQREREETEERYLLSLFLIFSDEEL